MGGLVATRGTPMNDDYDDDLLFGLDDIDLFKRGEQPEGWFEAQKDILVARCRAQNERLKEFLSTADPATVERFNKPL